MAEGTYEYECMRAELLGLEKPDHDEFMKNRQEHEKSQIEDEHHDTEALRVIDSEDEKLKGVSGGLEELNTILKKTQIKINRFKASCGSLTNLLKIKVGGKSGSQTSLNLDQQTETDMTDAPTNSLTVTDGSYIARTADETNEEDKSVGRKKDIAEALDRDLNNLDRMIEKAENAQYSMEYQRKEMKKFINK